MRFAFCALLAGTICVAAGLASFAIEPAGQGAKKADMSFDFEKDAPGKLPEGFETALTGGGKPVEWAVKEEAGPTGGKKVLAQLSADPTGFRFPLCICTGLKAKDVEISASFKPISGKEDQAGGLVVRYRDKDNYYVVRANALEDNVRFYKIEKGKRVQLAGKNGVEVPANKWHDLKLAAKGTHFQIFYEGKLLFEADDPTFQEPGLTGLWTKADSVTYFDDVKIHPAD